jgi:DNA polymerase III epsilon subunit-like protein
MRFISVDVETDGPLVGRNSLLSVGAVAFCTEHGELASFKVNLKRAGRPDPDTMKFWAAHPVAFIRATSDQEAPRTAMRKFAAWSSRFPDAAFAAWPVAFDYAFCHAYFLKYLGADPFGYGQRTIDISSYAMAVTGLPRSEVGEWLEKLYPMKNTHDALEDAREQGRAFLRLLERAKTVVR